MTEKDTDYLIGSDAIDDFDFHCETSKFTYTGDEADVATLILEGKTDNEDVPVLSEENENALRINIGKGWVIGNSGQSIEHETGKITKPINPKSHYGLWLDACISELGILGTLKARGTMRDAKTWLGLSFHIDRKEFKATINNEAVTWSKPLPSKFLGEAGGAVVAKTGKASEAVAPVSDAVAGEVPDFVGGKTLALLLKTASESEDYSQFVDRAFDVSGVSESKEIQSWLMSEDSFKSLKK